VTDRRIAGALIRYRVLANIVGVLLAVLVFVGIPLKYLADKPGTVAIVGFAHGMLYIVYCLTIIDLSIRLRWPLKRIIPLVLAGIIPIMTFVMERKVTHELAAEQPAATA
jgi:integral membrane protein